MNQQPENAFLPFTSLTLFLPKNVIENGMYRRDLKHRHKNDQGNDDYVQCKPGIFGYAT